MLLRRSILDYLQGTARCWGSYAVRLLVLFFILKSEGTPSKMSTITSGYIHLLLTNRQKLHCICLYYTSSGSIFHSTINLQSWFTLVIHNILNTEHQWIRWFPQLTFYGHCRNTEIMITMHRHKKITIKTTWPPCSTLSNTSNKLLTTECHLTDIQ